MMGHKAIESAELPRMNLCCIPTQREEYLLCASRRLSFERLINDPPVTVRSLCKLTRTKHIRRDETSEMVARQAAIADRRAGGEKRPKFNLQKFTCVPYSDTGRPGNTVIRHLSSLFAPVPIIS